MALEKLFAFFVAQKIYIEKLSRRIFIFIRRKFLEDIRRNTNVFPAF